MSKLSGQTSQFESEIGSCSRVLLKNVFLRTHYLGFHRCSQSVQIKSEIIVFATTGLV